MRNVDISAFQMLSEIDKHSETRMHMERVAKKLALCAKELHMPETLLHKCGFWHDLGKGALDPDILYKQGRPTPEEKEHIGLHARFGFEAIKGAGMESEVQEAALHHHDADETSPLFIQVLHLIDIEDALSAPRCYKAAMPLEKVVSILEEEYSHLSEEAVAIFKGHLHQFLSMNRS